MCFGILFSSFTFTGGGVVFLFLYSSFTEKFCGYTPDSQNPESRILLSIYDSGISLVQVLVARKYLLPPLPLVKQLHRRHAPGSSEQH